jgi:hypothetical protein
MRNFSRHERGATIAELAIGAMLLGIVIGMVLKGGVMIDIMKAQMVVGQLPRFQLNVQSYREDFRSLPGDDPAAERIWQRSPAMTRMADDSLVLLVGNARIEGKLFDLGNPAGEQFAAWRDLRYGGYIDGDPMLEGLSALPENPFGGFYAFDEGNMGQKRLSLCATKIPGRAALIVDQKLDDGRINAGKVVATSKFSIEDKNHFETPDTEPYNIEKEYIICLPGLP